MREDYKAIVVAGSKHTGKSTYVARRLGKLFNLKHQKLLIVTETDSTAWNQITVPTKKKIKPFRLNSIGAVKRWLESDKVPVAKYYDYDDPYFMLKELRKLANPNAGLLTGGGIVFDDCTNYIDPNPHRDVRGLLTNHRHYKLDIIFITHAIRFIPRYFWRMISAVTIFKTADEFRHERELLQRNIPNAGLMHRTWCRVQKQAKKDRFYNLTVTTGA